MGLAKASCNSPAGEPGVLRPWSPRALPVLRTRFFAVSGSNELPRPPGSGRCQRWRNPRAGHVLAAVTESTPDRSGPSRQGMSRSPVTGPRADEHPVVPAASARTSKAMLRPARARVTSCSTASRSARATSRSRSFALPVAPH